MLGPRSSLLRGLGHLESFPLIWGHGLWLLGAGEVGIGLFELARQPVGVCSEDGARLHELGVDLGTDDFC